MTVVDRLFTGLEWIVALMIGWALGRGDGWWIVGVGFLLGRWCGRFTSAALTRHRMRMHHG
jgi:hypothetical protein